MTAPEKEAPEPDLIRTLERVSRAAEWFLRETYSDGYVPSDGDASVELHDALAQWRTLRSMPKGIYRVPAQTLSSEGAEER